MSPKQAEIALNEFYLATSQLCKLLENASLFSKRVYLSSLHKMLGLVYLKASLIENASESDTGDPEKFVQESDWIFVKEQISSRLGVLDQYIEIPISEGNVPDNFEALTLSEALADIYQDLKDFSTNYEFGNEEAIGAALYSCMDNFPEYWGLRVLAVLTSLHLILYNADLDENDAEDLQDNKQNPDADKTKDWLINKRFNN